MLEFKKIRINRTRIVIYFLLFWFVVSLGFLGWNVFTGMRDSAVTHGYSLAIYDLFEQAENEECRPFSIFLEERQAELINVECLQLQEDLQDFED